MAKAIAYKQCGKDREAEFWAMNLLALLEQHDLIKAIAAQQRRAAA